MVWQNQSSECFGYTEVREKQYLDDASGLDWHVSPLLPSATARGAYSTGPPALLSALPSSFLSLLSVVATATICSVPVGTFYWTHVLIFPALLSLPSAAITNGLGSSFSNQFFPEQLHFRPCLEQDSSSLVLHMNQSTSMHVLVQVHPPQTSSFRQKFAHPYFPVCTFNLISGVCLSVRRKSLIFSFETIKKLCLLATKNRGRKRKFSIHIAWWLHRHLKVFFRAEIGRWFACLLPGCFLNFLLCLTALGLILWSSPNQASVIVWIQA